MVKACFCLRPALFLIDFHVRIELAHVSIPMRACVAAGSGFAMFPMRFFSRSMLHCRNTLWAFCHPTATYFGHEFANLQQRAIDTTMVRTTRATINTATTADIMSPILWLVGRGTCILHMEAHCFGFT